MKENEKIDSAMEMTYECFVDGAFYDVVGCDRFCGVIWLCNVVHTVFGAHPDLIYCKVIE